MLLVHPWNHLINALESFLVQSNYCSSDLAGLDKQATLLARFIDFVLIKNANSFRDRENFLSTRDLRNTWSAFFSSKSSSLAAKLKHSQQFRPQSKPTPPPLQAQLGGNSLPSERYNVAPYMFNNDICVLWNLGKCLKAPTKKVFFSGMCTTLGPIPQSLTLLAPRPTPHSPSPKSSTLLA